MFRVSASIYVEALTLNRRDGFKVFRVCGYSSVGAKEQTVLSGGAGAAGAAAAAGPAGAAAAAAGAAGAGAAAGGAAPRPPRPPRRWPALAALAVTSSVGGVFLYRRLNSDRRQDADPPETAAARYYETEAEFEAAGERARPAAALLPPHAQFLLVGGGTAAFAAMRAIRSARPDAQVLIVGAEPAPPYMRPPLSKELWREPKPADLTFRQRSGRRRALAYEPPAFYVPEERVREAGPGAALALGWRVTRLDPLRREAELEAGGERHALTFGRALLATGGRARRLPALAEAAAAGRSLALRGARDAARLARALEDPALRTVAVVGGGLLATELAAALADRLRGSGRRVVLLCRERAPLAGVLPPYLAAEAARGLAAAGVELLPDTEVLGCAVDAAGVRLALRGGARLGAELVLECVGCEPADELARRAGLELDPERGGVLVNAELQARADVFAAGDVASFYDGALGRRRVEHHDHAVLSGRLAGENMAGAAPARPYDRQSMFWSDLGPRLGYEAVGIVDSRLATVGVFSADAVGELAAGEAAVVAAGGAAVEAAGGSTVEAAGGASVAAAGGAAVAAAGGAAVAAAGGAAVAAAGGAAVAAAGGAAVAAAGGAAVAAAGGAAVAAAGGAAVAAAGGAPQRYERGVVFYLREQRVVGVLLWNLFDRVQVARQVVERGHFDDLVEAAKLFALHEDD